MSLKLRLLPFSICLLPFTAGCSESVPPAYMGAWHSSIVSGGDVTKTCPAGGKNESVGSVTATAHDELKKDNIDGAEIFCSVVQAGSAFTIHGRASWSGKTLEFDVANFTTDATTAAPVAGNIMIQTTNTQLPLYSAQAGQQCDFYMNQQQSGQLGPGKAWLSFNDCYVENSGATPAQRCKLISGHVAFQNCDDGESN